MKAMVTETRPRAVPTRSLWPSLLLAALLATAIGPGCGGGSTSSAPTQAPPTASALDFTIAPMVNNGTVVEFRWSGSGATSYRIEVGSTSGASDVATLDTAGPSTSFTWTGVGVGNFYARVKGRQGTTLGAPSNEVLVGSIDARQLVDALFFAYGPLAVVGNFGRGLLTGYWQDRALGWEPGTSFTVILGESVPAAFAASAEKTVQQIAPATKGAVNPTMGGRRPDPLPSPGPGEVTISMVTLSEVKDQCSCASCVGCATTWYRWSFAQRAQILMSPEAEVATAAHEIGHVVGLAHAISAAGVRPPLTMGLTTDARYAPNGRVDVLEPATVRMLETVYAAGLTAGSTRRQFEAAGLVPPEGTGAASLAASDRRAREYVVKEDGLETVVTKPFCEAVSQAQSSPRP
jgi:hypothetical protein